MVVVLAVQLLLADAFFLFQRNFWLDEIYTYILAGDPDVVHSLRALAGGVETHPPTYYLLLRAFAVLGGGPGEVVYRVAALLAVFLALLGVYALLRRRFSILVAATVVLALWCHPMVRYHAFEARAYGVWLAAIVWFAYFLERCRAKPRSWTAHLLVAVTAALVCTVHYFGILSLGLVTAADLVRRRRGGDLRRVLPAVAAGPVTLLLCLPMLLHQKASFSVATWVLAPTWSSTWACFQELLLPRALLLGLFAGLLVVVPVLRLVRRPPSTGADAEADWGGLLRLLALGLLPLVLLILSFTVQPMLLSRYALPAVVALAPPLAFLLARLPRTAVGATALCLAVVSAWDLREDAASYRQRDRQTQDLIAVLRSRTTDGIVLTRHCHALYVVCHYAPDLRDRCFFLEDHELGGQRLRYRSEVFTRDLARNYATFYGQPALFPWFEAVHPAKIYFIPGYLTFDGRPAPPDQIEMDDPEDVMPPDTKWRHLEQGLYELEPLKEDPQRGTSDTP
jgi:hypothetical protein